MRTLHAETAVVSVALLLTACAGPDTVSPASGPSGSSSAPEASSETEALTRVQTTCSGYYGGDDLSIDHRVDSWAAELDQPLTEESREAFSIISYRLDSRIRYADNGPVAMLKAIKTPFDEALAGTPADPDDVAEAVASLEAMCQDDGFTIPE
ncbi:hypothetical protein [Isoptericola sediminis]|uniref:Lipoprotein n=1 Tax=Isoptericola sediminis TaxID=2733572 RepID=A0A849JTP7_9MICO|nr:hypothetical protein [Isoptericola sediminis]NNU26672.1 hypothetical protein [Isoptericola sediminis]